MIAVEASAAVTGLNRADGAVGPLLDALVRLADAVAGLTAVLSSAAWPWVPIVLWTVFWLVLVEWRALLALLHRGGWGIVLLLAAGLYFIVGLLGSTSGGGVELPSASWLFGWRLSPEVQRLLNGGVLIVLALLAGAIQLGPWWSDHWRRRVRSWTAEDSTGDDVVMLPLGSLGRLEGPAFGVDSAGIS